jgi:hypothetical protein
MVALLFYVLDRVVIFVVIGADPFFSSLRFLSVSHSNTHCHCHCHCY